MTSAFSASFMKMAWPSGLLRLSVIAFLLRCRFWKSKPWRGLAGARRRRPGCVAAAALWRLDLDHVGAPVGELAHRRRPGAMGGEVDHADVRERQVGHGVSSVCCPSKQQAVVPTGAKRSGGILSKTTLFYFP